MRVRCAAFSLTVVVAAVLAPAAPPAHGQPMRVARVVKDEPLPALPAVVQQALQAAQLPPEALAGMAVPLSKAGPQRHWVHQPDRVMQPGSTMKLVTSVVALDQLGPNLRGFTELRSAAPLQDGVLQGDLVLKGGADPELGVAQFWALLQDLKHAGVRHVAGDLVIDRHHWRPARTDIGLPAFDSAPEFPYNVIPDALQLNSNLLPLAFRSDATALHAATVPALPGLEIRPSMVLNDASCRDWSNGWLAPLVQRDTTAEGPRIVIELLGSFPRNCNQRAQLQLIDRLDLAELLFRTLWQEMGGRWDGRAREADAPDAAPGIGPSSPATRLLARRQSRPWGEVLRVMNKSSDNALTRMLYLNLGVPAMAANPQASTAALAEQAVRRWFAEQRIDDRALVLDNGSGLSRSERVTPRLLVQMLTVAHRARYAPDFLMSLPTVGVDGTMGHRLKESPATGWARLKTGTLRNVVALAGYLNDPDGRPWAVALIINHDQASRGRPVLDALVDHMSRNGPLTGVPRWQRQRGPVRDRVGPGGEGP